MKINISLKVQIATIVLLVSFLLSSCDTNNANKSDNSNIDTNSLSITTNENQSRKILNDAINALDNVDDEFQWKDTHLLLKESQKALNDGKFELSTDLAQKVILQAKLMNEQQDFADEHWQNLIPKK